jgi:hypothetical protein
MNLTLFVIVSDTQILKCFEFTYYQQHIMPEWDADFVLMVTIRVKLSLCLLVQHYAMKTHGGVEVLLHLS